MLDVLASYYAGISDPSLIVKTKFLRHMPHNPPMGSEYVSYHSTDNFAFVKMTNNANNASILSNPKLCKFYTFCENSLC